jgi:hypothetical protein
MKTKSKRIINGIHPKMNPRAGVLARLVVVFGSASS